MVFARRNRNKERESDNTATIHSQSGVKRIGSFFRRKRKNKEQENDEENGKGSLDSQASAAHSAPIKGKDNKSTERKQKKVEYESFGDYATTVMRVKLEDMPKPVSSTDVVVRVQTSTASMADCFHRRGMCFDVLTPVTLPATPGIDVVGNIVACGERVQGFENGDRVAALIRTGGNARYAVVPQESLVRVPKSINSDKAICMVSVYMTAYQSLQKVVSKEQTLCGKKVLVVGGMGPVGQALIELCKNAGADTIYCTADKKQHPYVRRTLGAEPLPSEPEDWLRLVEGSMDIVFDGVCQDGFESSHSALGGNGRMVCYGVNSIMTKDGMGLLGAPQSARWARTKAKWFMVKCKEYDLWDSFWYAPATFKTDLKELFRLLKNGEIKPNVAKHIPLSEVADAQMFIEKGSAMGTVVCHPWRVRKSYMPKDKDCQEYEKQQQESENRDNEQKQQRQDESQNKKDKKNNSNNNQGSAEDEQREE